MATNAYERQPAEYVPVDLRVANIGTGNGYTVNLPPGAMLVQVGLYTDTAFNSATTTTGSISDGTTTFVNAQDVKSAGAETVAVASKFYPDGGTITFSLAETGAAATAGRAVGYVGYITLGRGGTIRD